MTNGEVLKLYNALENISANKDLKFNFQIGYALAKNREILRNEVKIISELRTKIFSEYGEANDKGDIIIPKEKIDLTGRKIEELMGMENPVEILMLSIDAFDSTDNQLNLDDMAGLSYMIYIPEYTSGPIEKQEQ